MKKSLLYILLVLFPITVLSQSLIPDWLTPGYQPSADARVLEVVTDSQGNVYITGNCYDTLTLGNLVNVFPPNSGKNAFVAKLTAFGDPIWVTPVFGPGNEEFMHIALSTDDHVYISGAFSGNTVMLGAITLQNQSQRDNFVAYLDTSGFVLWSISGGGNSSEIPSSIAADGQGNVIVTGRSHVGSVTTTLQFGTVFLQNANLNTDMLYIFKINNTGNVLWGRQLYTPSGLGNLCVLNDADVDTAGNIYVCGGFWANTLNFSGSASVLYSTNSVPPYLGDIYICKYNPSGGLTWAHKTGSTSGEVASTIAVNPAGDFYLAGSYDGTLWFGGNSLTNIDPSGQTGDAFIAKYAVTGFPLWGRGCRSFGDDLATSLATDGSNGVYLLATTDQGSVHVDTSLYTGYSKYIAHFSNGGVPTGITPVVGSGAMYPYTLACDVNGNVFHGGTFLGTITYNGVSYTDPPSTGGTAYLAKFTSPLLSIDSPTGRNQLINVFPNPSAGQLFIIPDESCIRISLYTLEGQLIFESPVNQGGKLPLEIQHSGTYLVRAIGRNSTCNKLITITP